ncbi:hypothetical protein ACFV6I_32475, partial [Kitasatospora sp. NPDC059803]
MARIVAAAVTLPALAFAGAGTATASTTSTQISGQHPRVNAPNGTLVLRSAATGLCIDDSNYGLRHFGCQDQSGQ